jgi:hypothetical protein
METTSRMTDLFCLVRLDMLHAMGPLPNQAAAIEASLQVEKESGEVYAIVPMTFLGVKLTKDEWDAHTSPDSSTPKEWKRGGYL